MLKHGTSRRTLRGASLVELMVGLTIGLLVVAGASALFAQQLAATRRTMLEARLNQDMRAAADLIVRDLRRASFWRDSITGTQAVGATSATASNPYRAVSSSADAVVYAFSRDATEDNALGAAEQFGFRRTSTGLLQMQVEQDSWLDLVDPSLVRITAFTITPTQRLLPLGDLCATACPPGTPNCPSTTVRQFNLVLRGQAVADAAVQRELRMAVRLRNDHLDGACPA